MTDRAAHVGYHLVGDGRRELEADIGYRPRPSRRVLRDSCAARRRRSISARSRSITALLIALGHRSTSPGKAAAPRLQLWVGLLLLIPASEVAIVIVQRLVALLIRPRRLLRLEFSDGLPPHARTMVIVPVLLTSVSEVEELLERLEVAALANVDPRIHFAILSDFVDAPRPRHAGGRRAHRCGAQTASTALNQRFARNRRQPLLSVSPRAAVERARSDLDGLGTQARARSRSSTGCCAARQTRASRCRSARWRFSRRCAIASRSTRTPACRGTSAKKLVGIIAHPLNQARLDPVSRRVTSGYGILQPRVSVTIASVIGLAVRAHLCRAHRRRPVHDGRVGPVPGSVRRGDLHRKRPVRRGCLHGGAREPRPGQRRAVSRSLRGTLTREPRSCPTSRSWTTIRPAFWRTHADSTGGREATGSCCRGCCLSCRRRTGWTRNPLPLIARWKIVDNLRRSLVAPATDRAVPVRLDVPAGQPESVDAGDAGRSDVRGVPLARRGDRAPRSPGSHGGCCCRNLLDDMKIALARAWLQLTFAAYHACEMTHAIAVTLVRVGVTRRKMLEWQTAATSRHLIDAASRGGTSAVCRADGGQPAVRDRLRSPRRPRCNLARCRRRCRSWRCGWPRRLSPTRSASRSRAGDWEIKPDDRRFLRLHGQKDVALLRRVRRTVRPLAAAGQRSGDTRSRRIAHRTSPTNIGMSLLATLAALRSRVHPHPRARRADRGDAVDARGPGTLRRSFLQLVRLADPCAADAAATSLRWTAATSPRRSSPSRSGLRELWSAVPAESDTSRDSRRSSFLLQQALDEEGRGASGHQPNRQQGIDRDAVATRSRRR